MQRTWMKVEKCIWNTNLFSIGTYLLTIYMQTFLYMVYDHAHNLFLPCILIFCWEVNLFQWYNNGEQELRRNLIIFSYHHHVLYSSVHARIQEIFPGGRKKKMADLSWDGWQNNSSRYSWISDGIRSELSSADLEGY